MPRFPMLASLARHKLTVLLLALQVALTCAIVCNVALMVAGRAAQMGWPSGVAEDELAMLDSASLDGGDPLARHAADLAALRSIPGVTAAAAVDALPFNGNNWGNGIATVPDGPARLVASAFNGTPGERQALGLQLVAGRDFRPDEYVPVDSANGWDGINQLGYWFFYPALIFITIADADFAGLQLDRMALALAIALPLMFALVLSLWPLLGRRGIVKASEYSSIFQTSVRWNGFMALAIAQKALFSSY